MRGGIDSQITHLFNSSDIFQPGASKHDLKQEVRTEYSDHGKRADWHDIGKQLPIISYNTAEAYKDVWHQAANFCKTNYGVKNIEKLSSENMSGFLAAKVNGGIAKSTFQQYSAACEKLEVALNMYANKFNTGNSYVFDLSDIRAYSNDKLDGNKHSRAYYDPMAVIGALEGRSEIIASIQYEGGARVSEVLSLRLDNFLANNRVLLDNTKGGLDRVISLPSEVYQRGLAHVANNGGRFIGDEDIKTAADKYRLDLKTVAGCGYQGSHGLRWNFAQESYARHIKNGMTPEQALATVSKELGHTRSDITLHYLK